MTDPWPPTLANKGIDALTFSGGVAEYLYKRETRRFGDLGDDLARRAAHALGAPARPAAGLGPRPGHPRDRDRRRAVLRADQRQHDPIAEPERAAAAEPAGAGLQTSRWARHRADVVAARGARSARAQPTSRRATSPVALAFPWRGDPSHARLHAVAAGICAALPQTLAAGAAARAADRRRRRHEPRPRDPHEIAPGAEVIAIDGVQLKQFDYVDIGRVIEVTNVVPIIIKSLLFK